jgi:hypothetical protein
MIGTLRLVLFIGGAILVLVGIVTMAVAGPAGLIGGIWVVGIGGAMLAAATLERLRYRSTAAERTNQPAGPGGGEPPGALEPRFVPTQEVFIDPTSRHRMRVFVDRRTGERRYLAED